MPAADVMSAPAATGRDAWLNLGRAVGAAVGYGCLVAFLYVISLQLYHWFRDGEWHPFDVSEALRVALARCCGGDGDAGRFAALARWLEAPVDWLGLHKLLEVLPASLALFAASILGNSLFVYCSDRIAFAAAGAATTPVDTEAEPAAEPPPDAPGEPDGAGVAPSGPAGSI